MSDDVDFSAMATSDLIDWLCDPTALSRRSQAARNELDARIPPRDAALRPASSGDALIVFPGLNPAQSELVDMLVVMVRRAGKEIPGKQMRLDFEADLVALLREYGRET